MKSISRNIAIICLLFTSLVGNAQMPEGFYDFMDTTAPGRIMYYDVVSDTVPIPVLIPWLIHGA